MLVHEIPNEIVTLIDEVDSVSAVFYTSQINRWRDRTHALPAVTVTVVSVSAEGGEKGARTVQQVRIACTIIVAYDTSAGEKVIEISDELKEKLIGHQLNDDVSPLRYIGGKVTDDDDGHVVWSDEYTTRVTY